MSQPVTKSPAFVAYRSGIIAAESGPFSVEAHGINCANYKEVMFNVIPSGGANPNITMYVWSESADQFILLNPTVTFTGAGVNTPYSIVFDCRGRVVFPAVTTLAAGSVDIEAQAFGLDSTL